MASKQPVFKPYLQDQVMAFPPTLGELVPKGHPVRVVNEVINKVNIQRPLGAGVKCSVTRAFVFVDTLVYSDSGNRLASVVDAVTAVDANYQLPPTTSYTYDANGNLKTRTNSGQPGNNITAIAYNHLNLPQSVTATAGNVTYTYDANGRKLRSVGGIVGQTRDYIDGIEYIGGTMELIHHSLSRA